MNKKSIITFFTIFVLVFPVVFSVLPNKAEAERYYFCCCGRTPGGQLTVGDSPSYVDDPPGGDLSNACTKSFPSPCNQNGCFRTANTVSFDDFLLEFYDTQVNIAHSWRQSGQQTIGSSGSSFIELASTLFAFGFMSGSDVQSYDTKTASAVTDLQRALKLTNQTAGVFTIGTRDAFGNMMLDLIGAIGGVPTNTNTDFGIIYPDGRFSTFSRSRIFSAPSANFSGISALTSIPKFILKQADGKVYIWNSQSRTWSISTSAFPTPKTSVAPSTPIKTPLSTLASTLSTIGSNLTTNFSTTRNVSSGTSNTVVVPSILQFLYNTGFSSYNPVSTASTFGPTSTEATKSLQGALGLTPSGTFDNTTATAATNLVNQINVAVNAPSLPTGIKSFFINFPGDKTFSAFVPATGTFIHTNPVVPPKNCGGVKQPPCVGIFTYHCCDEAGWCTSDVPGTCGSDGNTFCAGLAGSLGCRDVF